MKGPYSPLRRGRHAAGIRATPTSGHRFLPSSLFYPELPRGRPALSPSLFYPELPRGRPALSPSPSSPSPLQPWLSRGSNSANRAPLPLERSLVLRLPPSLAFAVTSPSHQSAFTAVSLVPPGRGHTVDCSSRSPPLAWLPVSEKNRA